VVWCLCLPTDAATGGARGARKRCQPRPSGGEPALLRKPGPERRVETRGAAPRAGQKHGGQALLGGLDCLVQRNFFGAQIDSFEAELPAPAALRSLPVDSAAGPADGAAGAAPGGGSFRALFIRAPAVLEAGASVEVLAEYRCARAGCRQALLRAPAIRGASRARGGACSVVHVGRRARTFASASAPAACMAACRLLSCLL